MSLVVCVCGEYFSIIMGDSRMISLSDNEIVDENIQKVLQLNDNVAIGFTGDPIPTSLALQELDNYNVKFLTLERIKRIMINKLKEITPNDLGVKIIFTGKNKSGKYVIYVADSERNYEAELLFAPHGSIAYALAGRNEEVCRQVLERNLFNKRWTRREDLENSMAKCIKDVAQIDNSVNTNICKVVIK